MLTCPCGVPVSPDYKERDIRGLLKAFGSVKLITTPDGTFLVPTIHILVHGVTGAYLPALSFVKRIS